MPEMIEIVDAEIQHMYLAHLAEPVGPAGRARARNPQMYNKFDLRTGRSKLYNEDVDWSKIWVWSDQHFWHKNIIGFSDRPYADVEHMNHELLKNYKMCVGDDDICIWVGDVTFGSTAETNHFLEAFPGYKILIVGNHDMEKKKVRKLNFDEIHLTLTIQAEEDLFLAFTHYPLEGYKLPHEFFTNMGIDVWNLHGHTHTREIYDPRLFNCSVEAINYCPSRLGEIVQVMKRKQREIWDRATKEIK